MGLNINGTTGISGVDASVSAPALTGTDSNTGISFPSADTIKFSTNGVERMSITNNGLSSTGHVLQVVQSVKTDGENYNSSSYVDTGLEVSITPTSTSNKVLVIISFNATTNVNTPAYFVLDRGGSMLGIGDADGSRVRAGVVVHQIDNDNDLQSSTIVHLDSPSTTSAITYKLRTRHDGSGAIYLNRTKNDTNNNGHGRTASSITAMEIGG